MVLIATKYYFVVYLIYNLLDIAQTEISDSAMWSIPTVFITNGTVAQPHSAPFAAFLGITTKDGSPSLCGGVLISHNYVLTAGHCVVNASDMGVYLGAHNINKGNELQVIMQAESWKAHENETTHDIGVIKLKESIDFNEGIQPATLPTRKDVSRSYIGETGRVFGWGVKEDGSISDVLLYADMPVIDNKKCEEPDIYICAAKVNKSGTCTGDSGGPFVINKVTVGLVHGSQCKRGNLDYPSAFINIAKYIDWIEDNTDVLIE